MAKAEDGGPAFPERQGYAAGMTLRDWFAGQTLAGNLLKESYPEWQLKAWFGGRSGLYREEIASRAAYAIADAMLAARQAS